MWNCSVDPDRGEWQLSFGDAVYYCEHFATDKDRPYAHPVRLPSGTDPLTAFQPSDHRWHMGFWFSWKFINGVNYWEDGADGHPDGRVRLAGAPRLEVAGEWMELTSEYTYHPFGRETPVAAERRIRRSYRPQEDQYWLDYSIECTALERLTLDRTPITPETPWGGYAGLSWRFAEQLDDVQGLDARGRADHAIEHQRAAWATMYGRLGEATVGAAMMDHPDNPRHPTHWRYIDDPQFHYLNPSLVLAEPLSLETGDRLRLKYRVVVYAGTPTKARMDEWYRAFCDGD